MIKDKSLLDEAKKKKKKPYDSVSYLTGSIALEIDRFNQAMGTKPEENNKDITDNVNTDLAGSNRDAGTGSGEGLGSEATNSDGGMGESLKLHEAKRYVRRYYIRPQNIFCSNKAEVVKALIDIGNANCSVYTLNNLGDEKDVTKLMNSDIIYYYDEGILYDKNHVRVMDYDLSIKKEENRKSFSKVNTDSKEFKDAYSDRMTTATELEESKSNKDINLDEAFNLDFDSYNVFGESLKEGKEEFCCICGEPLDDYGNNPEPYMLADEGQCCSACNYKFVIPKRMELMKED